MSNRHIAPEFNRIADVLSGPVTGHFTLPTAVQDALSQLTTLQAAWGSRQLPDVAAIEAAHIEAMVTAAGRAKPSWPDPEELVKAQHDLEVHRAWESAMLTAEEMLLRQALASVQDNMEAIITKHLRPALTEIINTAKEIADDYHLASKLTPRQLLHVSESVRESLITAENLSERYLHLRKAQRVLTTGYVTADTTGIFAEVSNLPELYGAQFNKRRQLGIEYFPSDPVARLIKIAEAPAKAWMPTPAEQDAAWNKEFGDQALKASHGKLRHFRD